jgi:predicted homoserine dehydrogenase-like protein
MTAPTPVRIGISGLGRMGRRHAENLARKTPGAELVAAASPVAEETAWAREILGVGAAYPPRRTAPGRSSSSDEPTTKRISTTHSFAISERP